MVSTMNPELLDFTGRVAIVTGGGTGIGFATALQLAKRGASVVVASRTVDELERSAATIRDRSGRPCLAVPTDVKDEEAVIRMVQRTVDEFGRVDILVNNAGGTRMGPLESIPTRGWDSIYDLNVRSAYFCTREAGKHMIGQRGGAIVNISSNAGITGVKGGAHYSSAKAALQMFTTVTAAEWGRYGIRANCVAGRYDRLGACGGSLEGGRAGYQQHDDDTAWPAGHAGRNRQHDRVLRQRRGLLHHRPDRRGERRTGARRHCARLTQRSPGSKRRDGRQLRSATTLRHRARRVARAGSEEVGSSDFGAGDYLPGLRVLLQSMDYDPQFSGRGRRYAWGTVVGVLKGRANALKSMAENPGSTLTHRESVVITGIPRTGTTALHKLMALDQRFQACRPGCSIRPCRAADRDLDRLSGVPQDGCHPRGALSGGPHETRRPPCGSGGSR